MATSPNFMGYMSPEIMQMLGMDPEAMRRASLSKGLLGASAALLSQGYSPVPQSPFAGLGQAMQGFQQGTAQAQQDALQNAMLGQTLKQYGREEEEYQSEKERQAKSIEMIEAWKLKQPEDRWPAIDAMLMSAPDKLAAMIAQSFEPAEPPATRERISGGMMIQEQWDPQTQTWTPYGQGSRFAPTQGPADPETIRLLQAAGIDPKSPEGQEIIRRKLAGSGDSGFTLGAGQTRHDAEGAVIAEGPEKVLTPSERERKYDDLIAMGIEPDLARKLADGYIAVGTDSMGNSVLVDKTQIGATAAPAPVADTTAQPASAEPSLEEAAGATSGIVAQTGKLLSDVLSQAPLVEDELAPVSQAATDQIRQFNQQARQVLGQTVDDKGTVAVQEQKWVNDLLVDPDSWLKSGAAARNRAARLRIYITSQIARVDQTLQSGTLSAGKRKQLTDHKANMQLLLSMMGADPAAASSDPAEWPTGEDPQ